MRFDRVSAMLELIRWQGRGLRGDPSSVRGLLDSCYVGLEVGLPEDLVLAGLSVLDVATRRMGTTSDAIRADFPQVCRYGRDVEAENLRAMGQIAARLAALGVDPSEALVLGDSAVLLSLFGSPGAFRAQTWAVGVPGSALDSDESVTIPAVLAAPFEITFGRLNRLEDRLEQRSVLVDVDGQSWRTPGSELLIVFMAARLGEPEANPSSNTWAHLAAGLKSLKGEIEIDDVLSLADELRVADRVHRGLVIVGVLFPELRVMIKPARLNVPAWEKVALRLAANKLVRVALAEGE